MKCVNCGRETHGGYCDCMIINGEFKGAWWKEKENSELKEKNKMNNKNGYGLSYTDRLSGNSILQGVYETDNEAKEDGRYKSLFLKTAKNPKVVKWNEVNQEDFDYVFTE